MENKSGLENKRALKNKSGLGSQRDLGNKCDNWIAIGFSSWKKKFIPDFLGADAQIKFLSAKRLFAARKRLSSENVIVWSSRLTPELESFCAELNLPLWQMEDGFVRSVGLGVDLVRPISLVLDATGIYYDASKPSDLETILNTHEFDSAYIERAETVMQMLIAGKISKYNVGNTSVLDLPTDKRILLVPGQIETDASILKGSPDIQTNAALLAAVRQSNPDAFIIYKPHPDIVAGGRDDSSLYTSQPLYDLEVIDSSIANLFDQIDELHTMTSLAGFEALLRGVDVVTYGLPFYAGWGVTKDRLLCERRTRQLSIEALVAGTLLLYPVYIDPLTRKPISCEEALEWIASNIDQPVGPSWLTQSGRFFKRALRMKQG
ncbi:hypothetical protein [Neptunomonas qingdaonensis]|uniref:Capsular polysaccharide export protein n=1 Tax=Neptunomonas qingdaonensis TaxID=1045558 RepID=A0A1I2PSD8_9GAMM|nr:hypothetical protein [Neptunomonas qingdaonensis]SFG19175.1 capsular polysaccharide export protein [Neptunomonas qingdaonensis]